MPISQIFFPAERVCVLAAQGEVEEVEQKLAEAEQKQLGPVRQALSKLCTPVFWEALILTFIAGNVNKKYPRKSLRPR